MARSLLSTKFYVPPQRVGSVSRPRLSERILSGFDRPQSFTLLSSPAGSGKTTLLSEVVSRLEGAVAWLSLDEADNDPRRFWTYLITACQRILPEIGQAALAVLEAGERLPSETIPTLLINELAASEQMLVLVLDDYHLIRHTGIQDSMFFFIDHQPDTLRVVISTRADPPWPLARYRARNRLVEIRARDLRFTLEETSEFLTQTMALTLSPADVSTLEARTEGWIAGLQLAAIAMQSSQQGTDTTAFVQAFSGSHLYVSEYLLEEVLRQHPQEVQTFLLQTSILNRLHASLCNTATGRQDGQTMLTVLRQANLFLVPLDADGQWFRYHHLFADLLQARLQQEQGSQAITDLHTRAAEWYEQNGFEEEAVRHALAAEDFERVVALVARLGQSMIFSDQYKLLQSWLDSLPPGSFQVHPRLEIYRVLLELTRGTVDMTEQTLREKEDLINALPSSPENKRLKVEAKVYLALFLAFQNTRRAIRIAQEALAKIPQEHLKLRAFLFSALYRAHGMEGDYDRAREAYEECMRLTQAARHYGMAANTTMIRTFDLCQYGKLDEAARYCKTIIDAGSHLLKGGSYLAGPAYIGLGGIYLERNQLKTAEEYLEQGIQLARQGGLYGLFTGYTQKARLYQARGLFDKAVAELEMLEQTLQRREFTLMARHVSLRLAMGDMAAAAQLENKLVELLDDSAYARRLPLIAVEAFKLSLARIVLAQGELGRATQILDEVRATVEPGKRFGRLLEVYLLRALLHQKQNGATRSSKALTCLERAVKLGEAAGFVMLFLEEGPALIPLLQGVASHNPDTPSGQYARDLLKAFGAEASVPATLPTTAEGLIETLTPREMEVLKLIAAGDSNQAIAGQLFITVRTVKKHASNIYGKLNVSSRTQAVARARELGLLPQSS